MSAAQASNIRAYDALIHDQRRLSRPRTIDMSIRDFERNAAECLRERLDLNNTEPADILRIRLMASRLCMGQLVVITEEDAARQFYEALTNPQESGSQPLVDRSPALRGMMGDFDPTTGDYKHWQEVNKVADPSYRLMREQGKPLVTSVIAEHIATLDRQLHQSRSGTLEMDISDFIKPIMLDATGMLMIGRALQDDEHRDIFSTLERGLYVSQGFDFFRHEHPFLATLFKGIMSSLVRRRNRQVDVYIDRFVAGYQPGSGILLPALVGRLLGENADVERLIRESRVGKLNPERAVALQKIKDTLRSAIMAGASTTAAAAAWALHYLSRHPTIKTRLYGVGTSNKEFDIIVGHVIEEVLRTRPPLFVTLPTQATTDLVVTTHQGQWLIPSGVAIGVWIGLLSSNREPERPVAADGDYNKPRATLPFGDGRRICKGASIARLEVVATIRALVEANIDFHFPTVTHQTFKGANMPYGPVKFRRAT